MACISGRFRFVSEDAAAATTTATTTQFCFQNFQQHKTIKQTNKQTNVHDDDQHPLIFSNTIIQCHPRYFSSHSKTTLHQKEKE
jgi:hypothetical protein